MKWLVFLVIVVFIFVFAKPYLQDMIPDLEQTNEATTVCVNVEVNVDIEHENRQNRVEVSWTTADAPGATTTEVVTSGATTEAVTEEPTTEATTETVTTEITTEGVPVEHYWEYSYYVESEDVVYYECCIAGCTATKSEKVPDLAILVESESAGVRLIVTGGLYPCAEAYLQHKDGTQEAAVLVDTLYTRDEYNGYIIADMSDVTHITVRSYDATNRREMSVVYNVIDGVILN